jgi:hypothetical protein
MAKTWKDDVFESFKNAFGLTQRWQIPGYLIEKTTILQREFEKASPEPARKDPGSPGNK